MKELLFISFFILILHEDVDAAMSQAQIKQAMKTVRNMCLPKSGASKDAVAKLQQGEFIEDDPKIKCYLSCALGMMQAIKNNKINLTFVRNQITKMLTPEAGSKIIATFESCQNVEGEDNCALAFNFAKCIYASDKESFLIP